MPQCCAVPYCSEKKGGHKFPKDETVSKKWLKAIRRDNYTPSKHSRVCKKHFNPNDYALPKESYAENPTPRLKPKAVPSRFSWNHETEQRKEIKRKHAERVHHQKKCETATFGSNTEKNQCEQHFTFVEVCEEQHSDNNSDINSNKDVSIQCSLCKCEESLTNTANLLEHESNRKSKLNMFQIENLKEKPDVVQFYTGFDNYNHFMFVFKLLRDEVNNLKCCPSLELAREKHALTLPDQFYLTLIKLRRNMCDKELSFHFEISETSVSKYFTTWINYLYCKFKDLNVWVLKKTVKENVMCQRKNTSCIVIIDCKETKNEKPQNPVSQQATYSNYESANTLKVLVGISGSGYVTFVSDAYGGSISDKELFEKSGIINLLLKGDISHKDVNMPQFQKKGSNHLKADQLRTSKKLSPERINVERVIDLEKTFPILSNKLSSNLVALIGKIMFVCFMLANFRKNIMKKDLDS